MSDQPSILVLAPYLSRRQAGASHATISIINALHRRGNVEVSVLAHSVEEGVLGPAVRVDVLPEPALNPLLWRVDRAMRATELRRSLARRVPGDSRRLPTMVYTQSMELGLAWRAADRMTPVVAHPGHVLVHREVVEESDRSPFWRSIDARIAERIERRTLRAAAWTHVVSNRLVAAARASHYGISEDRFTVQPLGIDLRRFGSRDPRGEIRARLGAVESDCVIASAARMVAWKNLDWLIRALPNLPAHCRLLMMGDGSERTRLEASVPEALRDRVTFTGHVDPAVWLAAADVFALPSQIESFGVAYAEAMAMGLPCVGLRYAPPERLSSAAEVIGDGIAGFVVDDEMQFVASLTRLASDRALRRTMSDAAQARARSLFSEDAYAEFLERLAFSGMPPLQSHR